MNKKQTLAMLLAGAMLLPANAFAASADDFSDFPSDWSAAGLRRAVDNGLLNGANGPDRWCGPADPCADGRHHQPRLCR